MTIAFACCDEGRREAIRAFADLNGIDFLEVASPSQRRLEVHFLKPLAIALGPANVRVEGGERVVNPTVIATSPDAARPQVLVVEVAHAGDFSPYTLRLTTGALHEQVPAGIDPVLSEVVFSFKVNCETDADCRPAHDCPAPERREPELDYLAKDYASFRRVMLDRMALLAPEWRERNPADLGVTLVELLAYVGDQLSYFQDAVATEAYLGTARRRVSVRRHARLVDYHMHDGVNARVWARILLDATTAPPSGLTLHRGLPLITGVAGLAPVVATQDYGAGAGAGGEVFETLHDVRVDPAHDELRFYTWGARGCCLPQGATRATLRGRLEHLAVGDVLVLAEKLGPRTGDPADADPAHRHAVRLTAVGAASDPLGGRLAVPPHDDPVDVTEIAWGAGDALPFALCISGTTESETFVEDVSVAYGNIVLADHGRTRPAQDLGAVPQPDLFRPAAPGDACEAPVREPVPPRFNPAFSERGVTQAVPFELDRPPYTAERPPQPASVLIGQDPHAAVPVATLFSEPGPTTWKPVRDLLGSDAARPEFVLEVEADASARVRFGDDRFGLRPAPGTRFTARYRVGNGTRGNVAAGSLAHVVSDDPALAGVANPLTAVGGTEPESAERVRQNAPAAFRTQERAVTPADYAEVATRSPEVQRAAATLRWTGSWRTVFLSVDRIAGAAIDGRFEDRLRDRLERFRLAGQDLEVDAPHFVSLELALFVCVRDDVFRADVAGAVRQVLSNRVLADGRRGLFHPDNFTFGQPVRLSPIYAAVQRVPGVATVEVTVFRRQGVPGSDARETGVLKLGRLEIARLDQDPDFPEHGRLTLTLGGGK